MSLCPTEIPRLDYQFVFSFPEAWMPSFSGSYRGRWTL